MKRVNLSTMTFVAFASLIFSGCMKQTYEAEPEYFDITNNCSSMVFIEYDTRNFSFHGFNTKENNLRIDSIWPNDIISSELRDKNYQLILSDTAFTRILSGLRFFKIENGDTLFVNPEDYIHRSDWESSIHDKPWTFFHKSVKNSFMIEETMF